MTVAEVVGVRLCCSGAGPRRALKSVSRGARLSLGTPTSHRTGAVPLALFRESRAIFRHQTCIDADEIEKHASVKSKYM